MVGLLIAEWQRRRTGGRAAFLTLTNQLAAQVLEEAAKLNLPAADLRGSRDRRSSGEEARFLGGSAIAVTSYSNLFNVNPVVNQCDALVLDDAHGGGEFAASMWTVRITAVDQPELLQQLLAILTPVMTEAQFAEIFDTVGPSRIALVELSLVPAAREHLCQLLDRLPGTNSVRYAWSLIRAHMHACHVFASKDVVAIRPYIAPTYDHAPFAGVKHRIYLSATLGDVEDLRRTYALDKIEAIRAAKEQDGRRYVFVPGLGLTDHQVLDALKSIWTRLQPQRAVAIAPSFIALGRLRTDLEQAFGSQIQFLGGRDVEESLTPFTASKSTVLALANRYDGLDLPDDDCRLLLLAESPRATNELETSLSSTWKLGPALRWREATRLVQGMGRCTRNATDFAVILLLGESLINAATNASLLRLLSLTLQKEIQWGRSQVKELGLGAESFAEMVIGLVSDPSYRQEADQLIADAVQEGPTKSPPTSVSIAAKEVAHSKAFWSGDYSHAQEVASEIADALSGDEWAGYRAWWLYCGSVAARHAGNLKGELDALRRAKATGINGGWLDHVLRSRGKATEVTRTSSDDLSRALSERIWTVLEELGWSGKRFGEFCEQTIQQLTTTDRHKTFHQGLEGLGRLLGAQSIRPSEQGDPDVIWRLGDRTWVCFEAKTEKGKDSHGISKKDVLQAKGHVNWVRFFETQGKRNVEIMAVIVAASPKIDQFAEPHKESLYFLSTADVLKWAKKAHKSLLELRTKYAGQDFAGSRTAFARDIERVGVDLAATVAAIRATPL